VSWRLGAFLLCTLGACFAPSKGLVVANGDDVSVLDPQRAASVSDLRILGALHAGLTRLDPMTLQAEASLAEDFSSSNGGRVWTFRLRSDLKWSDGTPLTARDLVRSWQQLLDPQVAAPYSAWLRDAQFECIDQTLTVRFPQPKPAFAEMCAAPTLAPVPAHAPVAQVGSGPFRLVERRIRDRIVVERNPHYWDVANVALEQIQFVTVESQVTALNLFLAGEIAYAPSAPPIAAERLLEEYPESFQPTPQFATTFLRFNVSDGPFADVATRRAFAAAIQSRSLTSSLGGGRTAALHFVPPNTPHWEPAPLPTWRSAARQPGALLPADARLPDYLEYLYNSSELNRDVAELLQSQWQSALGVRVRLANQEWKTFLAAQRSLQYQMSRSSWIGDYLDPLTFLEIFHSQDGNNRTGWANDVYDAFIEAARDSEPGPARLRLLREAERVLLDQAVIVPLYHEASLELVDPRLHGFHRNLRGYIDWGRLSWHTEQDGQA